jgi:hypothetical protein
MHESGNGRMFFRVLTGKEKKKHPPACVDKSWFPVYQRPF